MPHDRLERRSLALHRAIAAKLRERPELLAIAFENLDRWGSMGSRSQPYLDIWRGILSRPLEELLTLIVEDSERMRIAPVESICGCAPAQGAVAYL
jgi:hypothetical protein